jgi:hypothetical protein
MAAILVQQVSKPPPPLRGLNSHVPPAVEQLVLRALAKDPGDRYPDMEALRRAILDPDAYLASQPPIMPTSALLLDDQETVDVETSDQRPETRKTIGEFGSAPAHARVTEPEVTAVGEPVAETTDHQITVEVDSESGERGPAAATVRELSAEQAIHLERLTAVPAAAVGSQPRMPATASAPGQPSRPVPAVPENKTMGIATPLGFIGLTAPPPKKRWPAVVALAAVTVVIVAMVALATRDSAPAGAAADASLVGQATADAAPEAPPLPETVKLSVVSTPPGVEVFDQDGKRLGVTPMECRVPRANETRTLRLVHPDLVEREKTYDASQDIAIDVELTRRPRPSARSRRHRNSVQSKSRSKGDELLEKAKSDGVLRPKL